MGIKPTMKNMVQYTRGPEIHQMALEKAKKGRNYLGAHSQSLAKVMENLTTGEIQELEKMRVAWEMKGPPARQRREYVKDFCCPSSLMVISYCRTAEKKAAWRIHEFSQELYLTMGVWLVAWAGWCAPDGEKLWAM
jgi:hypothetical protein